MIGMHLPLLRLFGFCQDINRIFRGVTHQIILKRNDFFFLILLSNLELKILKQI